MTVKPNETPSAESARIGEPHERERLGPTGGPLHARREEDERLGLGDSGDRSRTEGNRGVGGASATWSVFVHRATIQLLDHEHHGEHDAGEAAHELRTVVHHHAHREACVRREPSRHRRPAPAYILYHMVIDIGRACRVC